MGEGPKHSDHSTKLLLKEHASNTDGFSLLATLGWHWTESLQRTLLLSLHKSTKQAQFMTSISQKRTPRYKEVKQLAWVYTDSRGTQRVQILYLLIPLHCTEQGDGSWALVWDPPAILWYRSSNSAPARCCVKGRPTGGLILLMFRRWICEVLLSWPGKNDLILISFKFHFFYSCVGLLQGFWDPAGIGGPLKGRTLGSAL